MYIYILDRKNNLINIEKNNFTKIEIMNIIPV